MHRRTLLTRIAACLLIPLAAVIPRKKLPPLRAGIKHYSFCPGGILDVTGTPEQLVQFYQAYQAVMWSDRVAQYAEAITLNHIVPLHVSVMANQIAKAQEAAETGHLLVTLHGYTIDHNNPDLWTKASEAAVLATGCVLTEEAAQLMQLCGANIQRLPSCTEELC